MSRNKFKIMNIPSISSLSGMNRYIVVILWLMTGPVSELIAEQLNSHFAFIALAILFSCFTSMAVILVRKTLKLMKRQIRPESEMDETIDNYESIEEEYDYRRDSFDDRVCDDLTQVLLNYLSFEDKIRFECLSKQFQSLVFNKQKLLVIKPNYEKSMNGIYFNDKNDNSDDFNLKAFEYVIMKCKSINEIKMDFDYLDSKHIRNKVLQLINKHCTQLKSIEFHSKGCFDTQLIKSFGLKFGSNLVKLSLKSDNSIRSDYKKELIRLCPNLVTIEGFDLEDFTIWRFCGNKLIVLNKLSNVSLSAADSNAELMKEFINLYENQLKSFKIKTYGRFPSEPLRGVSRVKQLIELSIYSFQLENGLSEILIEISENCKQLRKLSLNLECCDFEQNYENHWKVLNGFKQLTHLELNLHRIRYFNCQSLKELKNMKVLEIDLNFESSEVCLDHIERCFPKLEVLKLSSYRKMDFNNGFKTLTKLKCLKKISFRGKFPVFTSEGLLDLMNSNNKLFYIYINSDIQITDELINGFKALTIRKGNTFFKIYLNFEKNNLKTKFSGISGIICL